MYQVQDELLMTHISKLQGLQPYDKSMITNTTYTDLKKFIHSDISDHQTLRLIIPLSKHKGHNSVIT